jgi:hypothetical protein
MDAQPLVGEMSPEHTARIIAWRPDVVIIDPKLQHRDRLRELTTALAEAGKRNLQGKPLRLSGAGIQAVRAILEDYAAAIDVLSARTMIRAHRLTERRLIDIMQGRKMAHDVEIISA